MKQSNYFSWENISGVADIDSHIVYASSLINKYKWKEATKHCLEKQLSAIVEKQNDKLLNISVIGEFSTGKSSFINALVGYELLAVNVIQGTTIAITMIEYSDKFSITLTDFAGKSFKKIYQSIDALRKSLRTYTTDASYAKKINYVTVTLPSSILKSGYRIIDTPGTNSLQLWHEDITRRAIRELSDLSIIITDATQPMPTTLISFVDNTLSDSIKGCVFVANKIDRIKEKEREGVMNFIAKKVQQNFAIEELMVLPFSSVALTNTFARETVAVDRGSFLLSTNSLQQLLSYTGKHKVKAQARKILHLICDIYSHLDSNVRRIAAQYQEKLKMLERSKRTDLEPFVATQISSRRDSFLLKAKDYKHKVESVCDTLVSNAQNSIETKIDNFENLDRLSEYIKVSLSCDIKKEGLSIIKVAESMSNKLKEIFFEELKCFQKDFEGEFEKLKIFPVNFNLKPKDMKARHSTHSANVEPAMTLISEELSGENWRFWGGGAAGAIAGSLVFPVVGTVIGGVIGLFVGAPTASRILKTKDKVKSKLSIPLFSYYSALVGEYMKNYNEYVDEISGFLESEIYRYQCAYLSIVEQEIEDWSVRYRNVKSENLKFEKEINELNNRQQIIKQIISNL